MRNITPSDFALEGQQRLIIGVDPSYLVMTGWQNDRANLKVEGNVCS